jgi:ribosomal protein S27AE
LIKKPRQIPLKVPFCEALIPRLDPNHPKLTVIKNEHGTYYSGYIGEKNLDYHLSTLPPKRYHIFNGLRLKNDLSTSQIDTLLITLNYTFILEVKNYTGDLFLDTPLNQLIQTKGESKEVYPCPILQAQRQQFELHKWLQSHNFPNLPVEYIVVFTHKKAFLKTHPGNTSIFSQICKSPDIKNRVEKLDKLLTVERLSEKELKKLGKSLLNNHQAIWSYTFLDEYKIDKKDIITGVQCPRCRKFGMKYHQRGWICPKCHARSKNALELAVRDYFILIKSTITNSELRAFLHLPNARVANRILSTLNLRSSGEKKARVYHAPEEYPYYQ